MKKLQKATFRIFLSCMIITAILMLIFVWMPQLEQTSKTGPAPIMQFVFTFFIIGLTAFLIWITSVIMEIRDNIKK